MPSTPGCPATPSPTVLARAHDQVEDARGQPASWKISVSIAPQRRIAGRLEDDRVAGHQGGAAAGPTASAIGKLNGLMTANTPSGRSTSACGPSHRRDCPSAGLKPSSSSTVAAPADQVGRLLDVAERLQPVLADLDGHQRGEFHLPLADEVRRATQDATRSCHGRPLQAGRAGGCDRSLHIAARALGEGPDKAAVDRRALLEVASPSRHVPSTRFGWTAPGGSVARSRPASNCACSSSLSLRRVAYVILMRSAVIARLPWGASRVTCGRAAVGQTWVEV